MPHVGPVLKGRTFFCPHCGALYSATPSLVPRSQPETAKCVVCGKDMDWSKAIKAGSSSTDLKMPD
jgi:transcription elongation factor Elf1